MPRKAKPKTCRDAMLPSPFRPGDIVVFDPSQFSPVFWDSLSEADRLRYYGPLGYGSPAPVLFVYLCSIHAGHCVIVPLSGGAPQCMRHDTDFRLALESEL